MAPTRIVRALRSLIVIGGASASGKGVAEAGSGWRDQRGLVGRGAAAVSLQARHPRPVPHSIRHHDRCEVDAEASIAGNSWCLVLLVVLGATIYLDQPRDSVDPSPMRMVAFDAALVLVTMAVSWSSARAAIIYGVRLRLAEQDQLAQVDALIHGSITPDPSSGPGDSLWRELLLVAARHVNRRKST